MTNILGFRLQDRGLAVFSGGGKKEIKKNL